ncbi:prevent-host-death family protein [Streptomyces xiamenensis]|uniref:prevent-host-death family protein n=1 Tax=Streptomyces xiamenensis TaxID=408015 RepID=UPI0035E2A919
MDINQADHPIVEARANLSDLLSAVQLLRRTYFLTGRGKRKAAVIPKELGELIERAGGPDRAAAILEGHLASADHDRTSPR